MTSDPVARYLTERAAQHGRRVRLRPLIGNEVLDTALQLYRNLGWTFLRQSLVPSLFCLASIAFTTQYVLPSLFSTQDPTSQTRQIGEAASAIGLALLIGVPLFLIGVSYTSALVIRLASDHLLGHEVDASRASEDAATDLPKILMVAVRQMAVGLSGIGVATVIIFLGGFLANSQDGDILGALLVAGGSVAEMVGFGFLLYVISVQSLAVPAAVIEGISPKKAAKRSALLMKGTRYHTSGTSSLSGLYGFLFTASLVLWGGSALIYNLSGLREAIENLTLGLGFQGLILAAADLLPLYLMVWALVPVWAVTVTVVYYDRRIRKEGFDIDALAAEA